MTDYNPENLNASADDAEVSDNANGEIVEIEQMTASDAFGEDTQGDPNKDVIECTIETDATENAIVEYYALPQYDMSWVNPTFKLGRFKQRYDSVPKVGMTVSLSVGDSGYIGVDIPDRIKN